MRKKKTTNQTDYILFYAFGDCGRLVFELLFLGVIIMMLMMMRRPSNFCFIVAFYLNLIVFDGRRGRNEISLDFVSKAYAYRAPLRSFFCLHFLHWLIVVDADVMLCFSLCFCNGCRRLCARTNYVYTCSPLLIQFNYLRWIEGRV